MRWHYYNSKNDIIVKFTLDIPSGDVRFVIIGDEKKVSDAELRVMGDYQPVTGWEFAWDK